MADGRFLSKTIAQSVQLASLSDLAEILFYRCLPHLDVEGRMVGDPRLVKALVAPLKDALTVEVIRDLLYELGETRDEEGAPLCQWYDVKGKLVLAFPGFARHQRGLRKDKEAPSRLPAYADGATLVARRVRPRTEEGRTNSGPTPEEVGVREEKRREGGREGKGKVSRAGVVVADAPTNWVPEAVQMYAEHIGLVPHGHMGKALKPAVESYGWPKVRTWFDAYCRLRPYQRANGSFPRNPDEAEKNTRFCSPDEFVKNLAFWRELVETPEAA